jgi:phosphotransferase system  glucose/maltose/N-acetylglucosamine-specific IIC component
MSRFMIVGGFFAFLVVFITGLISDRSIFVVLRDSMIVCLVIAFLLRLLYMQIENCLATVLEKEIQAKREKALAEAKEKNP